MASSIESITARDIMSPEVLSVHPREQVHDAIRTMAENGLSLLPVVTGDNRCLGVVSQVDLIQLTYSVDEDDLEHPRDARSVVNGPARLSDVTNELIDDVMSHTVVSVSPDAELKQVADVMLRYLIHHIPVIDENDHLLGIISTIDVLAAMQSKSA